MTRRRKGFDLNGIVLLNKPKGISSNLALQKVKHLFHAAKAGHTGNLDPMATGMLPICFGRATKLSEYMLESDKTYEAVIKLGEKTDTGDAEGEVIETKAVPQFSEEQLQSVLNSFLGEISQIPPMYSALKHNGKCLYELARKGETVERKARKVQIYEISTSPSSLVEEGRGGGEKSPSLRITVTCSKGTYIRTLGEAIAEKLGTVGHLTALHRTQAAGFKENEMKPLEAYSGAAEEILPVNTGLNYYPEIQITTDQATALLQGKKIELPKLEAGLNANIKLMCGTELFAIGVVESGKLASRKIIA